MSDKALRLQLNHTLMQDYIKRWMTWLGLGNAAGLAAVAGKFLDVIDKPTALILFPSCWAFALGVIGGAAFAFAGYIHSLVVQAHWNAEDIATEKQMEFWMDAMKVLGFIGQTVAVLGFLFGLLYPLVVLSGRSFVLAI